MRCLVNEEMTDTLCEFAAGTPPGAFVEVGVYQGGTAVALHRLAQEQERELYLFDTFEGTPVACAYDTHKVGDFADTSVEAVRARCPEAVIVRGVFPQSMLYTGPVAFVHADADQYSSTIAICAQFKPLMVPGGLMLFDDYGQLFGCKLAVDTFFGNRVEQLDDLRALVRF